MRGTVTGRRRRRRRVRVQRQRVVARHGTGRRGAQPVQQMVRRRLIDEKKTRKNVFDDFRCTDDSEPVSHHLHFGFFFIDI